jgi:hypothetical protein
MQTQEIVDAVLALTDEQAVLRVGEAVNKRVEKLRSERIRDLSRRLHIGTRVRLNQQARPQRPMWGLTATVCERPKEAMVVVMLDEPALAEGNSFRDGSVMVAVEAIDLLPGGEEDSA